jgi:hypothetical protein
MAATLAALASLVIACLAADKKPAVGQKSKAERPFTPGGEWRAGDMARPRPPVITPPTWGSDEQPAQPPSDAIVLFDGTSLAQWKREVKPGDPETSDTPKWKVEHGYVEIAPKTGTVRTREKFTGDYQLHVEWATPAVVSGSGQGRGNSGVFVGGFPEVQVLDSYENDTYPDGQAGALYSQHPPLVNASRPPGRWQTYDILFERARLDAQGTVTRPARLTVLHNGVVVHHAREFDTRAQSGDIALQDHNNPVRYRNLWLRPLNTDATGNVAPLKK